VKNKSEKKMSEAQQVKEESRAREAIEIFDKKVEQIFSN
jgi:hypothetical protein